MPRNSSGTYSTPAGQPVVSGTTISSTTFNNLVSDLSTELTDSASRSGKGGFTAPVRTADGTAAAPAHSFTSETGTGVYRVGASQLGIAIAGTRRVQIDTQGVGIPDGLGVLGNITTSGADLVLDRAGDQGVSKNTSGALYVGTNVDSNVIVKRNAATVATFTAAALDNHSRPIVNVTNPTNAQDAATKNYVDVGQGATAFSGKPTATATASGDGSTTLTTKGYVEAMSWETNGKSGIVWGTNWGDDAVTTGTRLFKLGRYVFLNVSAALSSGTASTMMTLPAGYRPAGTPGAYVVEAVAIDETNVTYRAQINTTGAIVLSPPPTAGRRYGLHVTFTAP